MAIPVVFLHSTGTGPSMWERSFAGLTHLDVHLVALPNVGYASGASASPSLPCALARGTTCLVADQVAHLAALLPREPFHLVAHSFGAFLALELLLASREPEGAASGLASRVRSLWMWEPVLFGALAATVADDHPDRAKDPLAQSSWLVSDHARGGTDPWLALFVDYWNGEGAYAKLPEGARASMRDLGWTMFQEVRATALADVPFDAYPIDVPCTLAYGASSPPASRAMVAALARTHPSLQVEAHEGLGHMAPLTRARAVMASVAAHLVRHGMTLRESVDSK